MYIPSQVGYEAMMGAMLVFTVLTGVLAHRLSAWQFAGLWVAAVSCTAIVGLVAMRGDRFLDVEVLGTGIGAVALVTDFTGIVTRWIARWSDAEICLRTWRRWLTRWLGMFIAGLTWVLVRDGWSSGNCLGVFVPYPHQSFVGALQRSYEDALLLVVFFLALPLTAAAIAGRVARADRCRDAARMAAGGVSALEFSPPSVVGVGVR